MRKILRLSFILLPALGGLIVLYLLFIPKNYEVAPFKKRYGTQYWTLATGSTIGFTKIEAEGPTPQPPILYLHGGPGGGASDQTIEVLRPLAQEGYPLYFYDQIGGGHSPRLDNIEDYTVQRHLADLEVIIEQIQAPKVILLGHSWGAILATLYTADHPEQIDRLLLTGPGPLAPIRWELAAQQAPDSLDLRPPAITNQQAGQRVQSLRSRLVDRWAFSFGKKLADDGEADAFAAYLFSELNKSAVRDAALLPEARIGIGYYAHIMTFKSFAAVADRRAQLRQSEVPILLMRGQYDNQKWGFAQEYLELFSNHRLAIIPDAGHFIEWEQPEVYLQIIRDFLLEKDEEHPRSDDG
ncbi:MAG: alpha/beta hydrolase [Bacteroidota bacterium]